MLASESKNMMLLHVACYNLDVNYFLKKACVLKALGPSW